MIYKILFESILLCAMSAEDRGIQVRLEPLFPGETTGIYEYNEKATLDEKLRVSGIYLKIIYKNISEDTVVMENLLPGALWAWRATGWLVLVILDSQNRDVFTQGGYLDCLIRGPVGKNSKPTPDWSRKKLIQDFRDAVAVPPGDSVIQLLNLVDCVRLSPGANTYTLQEFHLNLDKYGDWVGVWNGRVDILDIGYRFEVREGKVSREECGLYLSDYRFGNKKGPHSEDSLVKQVERWLKDDPTSLNILRGIDEAARVHSEKIKKGKGLTPSEQMLTEAEYICSLVDSLNAQGYQSEFLKRDYWNYYYLYVQTRKFYLGEEDEK